MRRTFGERVASALAERGPLCVGIDPSPNLLAAWGLPDDPAGLERFSRTVVEAVGDLVAVLKPQSAFFERHGSRGIAVLETVLAESRARGAVVLLDVKRGDIGSTTAAYADAYLDRSSPLAADAVTVSPYLGFGSLDPMIERAKEHDAGLFVLARTSNPEGASVQLATGSDGLTVAESVIARVAALNDGVAPLGSIGVVLGATLSGLAPLVSRLNGPILAPGIGAQGAKPGDLRAVFGGGAIVIPSVSRALLSHGPGIGDLREGARQFIDECAEALA